MTLVLRSSRVPPLGGLVLAALASCFPFACSREPRAIDVMPEKECVPFEDRRHTAPYPVALEAHLDDPALAPAFDAPEGVRPSVLNAVAYARFGAELLVDGPVSPEPRALAEVLTTSAEGSGVEAQEARRLFQVTANEADQAQFRAEITAHARGVDPTAPLARLALRVADARAALASCTEGPGSPTPAACCAALAVPWFFSEADAELEAEPRAALDRAASDGTFYREVAARALAEAEAEVARGASTSPQPFRHEGIRAWLTVCSPALDHLPPTLESLRAEHGDYTCDARYAAELHPVSMAKRAGRRVFRHLEAPVSIAESLGPDCVVIETEIIVGRSDGRLEFASYGPDGRRQPHGLFPAPRNTDAIKMTPDSCLGCHYTLDTRRFAVRIPSWSVLGLQLRRVDGVPNWRDDTACAAQGEAVVWHLRDEGP